MNRRIAWLISLIPGACMAGMALAVVLYMVTMIQDALASGRSMQMPFGQILALGGMTVFFGGLALWMWGIIDIANRRIVWLMLGAFGLALVWILYKEIREAIAGGRLLQMLLEVALVLVAGIVSLAGWGLVGWGIDALRRQIRKRQYRLPEGVTMEMVLRESPYELVRGASDFGEPDYYVVDKRTGEFVDWKDPDGAEAWIIRQYLKQRRNERQNRTFKMGRA